MDQNQEVRAKYAEVHRLLKETYGSPQWRSHLPPVDELVSTILSQSTSDGNRDKAFLALKNDFPDWEAVMNAPVEQVVATIRPAGLANQKAPRIQKALHDISAERGELSLDFLADWPVPEAKRWLIRLDGVGPKTAAIVLLFSLGRPAFPVDTHVHRVTTRLGIIGPEVTADKAHDILENIVNPSDYYADHLNLIRHGREIRAARNPRCPGCPLNAVCADYLVRTAGAA